MKPAEELRAAATRLRTLTGALPANDWGTRPWHAEECSGTGDMSPCPCIVAQGEYREFDQPQIPLIQYVADAENPEFAAYIAAMHPGVGRALATWLEHEAAGHEAVQGLGEVTTELLNVQLEQADYGAQITHSTLPQALSVARAINGGEA